MIKILNLQLSDMFCHAIANRIGGETYMDSYSAWSRRELDSPKHYRCWLGVKLKARIRRFLIGPAQCLMMKLSFLTIACNKSLKAIHVCM